MTNYVSSLPEGGVAALIIGKPTLQTVLDLIEDVGCPVCGESSGDIHINGPDEIVLGCGHVVDAKAWIDAHQ